MSEYICPVCQAKACGDKGPYKCFCEDGGNTMIDVGIVPEMKAICHGEFFMEVKFTCTACDWMDPQEDCEYCGGDTHWTEKKMISWTTVKEIYQKMAMAKAVSQGK